MIKSLTLDQIDLRLIVGEPVADQPIKITCPLHKHYLGVEDDKASMAVYEKNVHCFGCHAHLKRRGASAMFLMGEWDGLGDEDGPEVTEAIRRTKPQLEEYKYTVRPGKSSRPKWVAPAPSRYEVEAFHRYLLKYEPEALEELIHKRGYSLETIQQYKFGHTGTHYTIPVPRLDGGYETIRYRADERVVDVGDTSFRKYDGKFGRNAPMLYPLPVLSGLSGVGRLWVTEGEFDAASSNQAGEVTLTITNGATNIGKIGEMVVEMFPKLVVEEWVVATDQDAAGEMAARKIWPLLPGPKRRAIWSGAKDLTEYYAAGGRKEEIQYAVHIA